jgi:hypothetical protein
MLVQVRRRLTYANVVATLALFVALSTGGAYAANTIFSGDIVDGEVKTPDLAAEAVTSGKLKLGSVTTNRLAGGAVTTEKVKNENLTGADVLDSTIRSADIAPLTITGFDIGFNAIEDVHVKDDILTEFDIEEARLFHCHAGAALFGRLCAGGGATGTAAQAVTQCTSIGLRLPSWGEAFRAGVRRSRSPSTMTSRA